MKEKVGIICHPLNFTKHWPFPFTSLKGDQYRWKRWWGMINRMKGLRAQKTMIQQNKDQYKSSYAQVSNIKGNVRYCITKQKFNASNLLTLLIKWAKCLTKLTWSFLKISLTIARAIVSFHPRLSTLPLMDTKFFNISIASWRKNESLKYLLEPPPYDTQYLETLASTFNFIPWPHTQPRPHLRTSHFLYKRILQRGLFV